MSSYGAIFRVARVVLPARPRVFSALRWSFAPTAAAARTNVGIVRASALPFGSLGLALGEDPGSGGCAKGK